MLAPIALLSTVIRLLAQLDEGEAEAVSIPLTGSVGNGGANVAANVAAVQARLNQLGFTWPLADGSGVAGTRTIAAIRLFQAVKNGNQTIGVAQNDGRIDPNGDTHRWLEAGNAPRWQFMPAGSDAEGFVNIEVADPSDTHDFGTDWLARFIADAGAAYQADYRSAHSPSAPITINDASLPQGGNTPDHQGHETGLSCDLRLPRTDGTAPGGTTVAHPRYDRAAARAMLQALAAQPLFHLAYLNDNVLIAAGLCIAQADHDDHIHVQIRPPARA